MPVPFDSNGTSIALTATDDDSPALPISYVIATGPMHGSLSSFNASTGAVTYTPTAGYQGSDRFTFEASNGTNLSPAATVTLDVATAGTPTANAQTVAVAHDSTGTPITLTGSEPDSPPLPLTYAFTQPAHGTVAVSGSAGSPTVVYTPAAGYHGADGFTFTVNNGTNTSSAATVTLNVAAGTPTAASQSVTVAHDSTGTPITLSATDDDAPALSMSFTFTQPAHGSVTISGPTGSPALVYTPAAGYHGSDSFTFTASNGTNTSNTATVTLNVAACTPTANTQTVSVTHDSTDTPITLTGADDDSPALPLTYAIATGPADGSLSSFDPATGAVTYTPAAGYHGPDSFTFTVNNGVTTGAPASVTLNVAAGTPTATDQAVTTGENTALPITLGGTDDNSPALPQTFAFTQPAHGTVTVTGNAGSPTVIYTPAAGYTGTDRFTFTDSNGVNISASATVSISVTPPVQATVGGSVGVTWGTAGTATLLTNADGLRLLPSGRNTDMPWLGIKTLSITLSQVEALSASDVTVTGINIANYGPVTISGSGTNYTITLAQPINAADRVTVTIGNAGIATFTRRLDVLPGDVNDDGVVNSQDIALERNAYLANIPVVIDDILGDGTVDLNDYNAVRRLVNTKLPPLV